MCKHCNDLGMPGFCTNNDVLDFVYQNYECNKILPALLNVYRYLKAIKTKKTFSSFTMAKDGKKVCSRGGETKPADYDNFGYNPNTRDKFTSSCLECKQKYDRDRHLKTAYNMSFDSAKERLCGQNDSCASCGDLITMDTKDTHHKKGTKIVYDFLCHSCNMVLGYAHHDYRILLKCLLYQASIEGINLETLRDLLKGSFRLERI